MNDRLIMLHGIHLNGYDGKLEGFYPGSFKWAAKSGWGGEVFNFRPTRGRCYGHVEVLDHSIHIEKLGTSRKSESIDNVLVVWTAPDPSPRRGRIVIGWYRNATLYRHRQWPSGALKQARTFSPPKSGKPKILSFQVEAAEQDCTLLTPEDRVLWIPPRQKGDKGIPGRSPVYFPYLQKEVGPEIARRIRHYIDTREALSLAEIVVRKSRRTRSKYQPDPERRREIEIAAMEFVTDHFEVKGYTVQDVSKANLGYDLVAAKGDSNLCIEVKGRSGTEVTADFTVNEFATIRLEQRGKFEDGSYRICIVTDALGEQAGASMHHFWYVNPTNEQRKRGVRPAWRNINGHGILELIIKEAAQGRLR